MKNNYDIIVIGAGHAGCEAALAAARLGMHTLVLTINLDTIAQMSCNPAIGGLAKGHIVKEIDALGGEMGKVTDQTAIQFRILNRKKGPAVWAPRAQADKKLYQFMIKNILEQQAGLDLRQDSVEEILVKNNKASGVKTFLGEIYKAKCIIVTTGTFLNGLLHIGEHSFAGGRIAEPAALKLSDSLKNTGLELGRLKTGTPPRINFKTIDISQTEIQEGDKEIIPFSFSTKEINIEQIPCYITYTNKKTHKIIQKNLHRAPLYSGQIIGIGPRYCPSIESKIVKFADKSRHQIFLELEGRNTQEVYVNGCATSLPTDVQQDFIHSISGLEDAEIIKYGYAVEYDYVNPIQLKPSLESKKTANLFLAGQINGTSGYEEAAGQGLVSGINACAKIKKQEPLILSRSESYIGVLIDDLVTKGTEEPYRMFTSRAEYRLYLRQDNADLRLRKYGFKYGLVAKEEYLKTEEKRNLIQQEIESLKKEKHKNKSLHQLLKNPKNTYTEIAPLRKNKQRPDKEITRQVEIEIKYEGYIQRQLVSIEKFKRLEDKKIPNWIDYDKIKGLKKETREKFKEIKPISIGQALRISGITPADISILMIWLEKGRK